MFRFLPAILLALLLGPAEISLADRGPGTTPFSTATPFFPSTTHPLAPTAFWGSLKKPYPTGAHWTNAVLDNGNLPTAALPYVSTPQANGLTVSYPKITCSSPACFGSPTNDFTVGATGLARRYVVDYDSLSWTMQWKVGAARDLETHLESDNTWSTARSKAGTSSTNEAASYRIQANSLDCVLNQSFVADLSNPDRWESSYPSYDCGTPTTPQAPPTAPVPTQPPPTPTPTTPPPTQPPPTPTPVSPPPTTPTPTPSVAPPPVGTEPGVITGVPANAMTIHMVYGSPYLTIKYGSLIPIISSSNALQSVNGATNQGQFSGSKFILTYNTGNRWIVYVVGGTLTFTWSGNTLTASSSFTGVIRIAAAPSASYDSMLDARVTPYAIAAKVSTSFSGDVGTYYFQWITEGGDANSLMMLTLPHHRDSLVGASYLSPSWTSLKGAMTPMIGATWTLREQLTDIKWNARSAIDSSKIAQLNQALASDLASYPGMPQDTYSFGKVAARYARLVLIADQLGNTAARDNFLQRLVNVMTPWMTGSATGNSLLYDSTWGGTISSLGRANSGAEYGQAWYNDQHFHWGYFLYSAAVIAKYNTGWATQYKGAINDLARGIGNPSPQDPYFPVTRHKDWFVSHSWASGLFSFGDAKNQESTSEAVNGYYGLYLWGLAIGDNNIRDTGRLLMATELRGTQKYWHMLPTDTSIYSSVFSAHTCIGIVWNTKVDYATWFGLNVEYIHGIQMLPYTPITEDLLPKSWINVEYPLLATSLTRTDPVIQEGWRGFVFMTQAIINREAAWNAAQTLTGYDNGNSQTNTLYWIATRPT